MRRAALSLLALLAFDVAAVPQMIDAHAHYSGPDAAAFAPAEVIAKLDAAGVSRLVTTSSPPTRAHRCSRNWCSSPPRAIWC